VRTNGDGGRDEGEMGAISGGYNNVFGTVVHVPR
jgi:hypothetical protein